MPLPADTALLVVDLQRDFCPGGALPVPDGDHIVPVVNRLAAAFDTAGRQVFASRDWHPATTKHFRSGGGPWPVHCVAGTPGAAFHEGFHLPASAMVVTKGDTTEDHGYSAFDGHVADGRSFGAVLDALGIRHLVVAGLATDYCVKHSVLDALKRGLAVTVVTDAIGGVNVKPGDAEAALEEMAKAGAERKRSSQLV